jgi:hypothetical protein
VWCAAPAGHPYAGVTEDSLSLRRLHWQPVGLVLVGGGPVRVSISSVETMRRRAVTLAPPLVTLLTGIGAEDGSYVEMSPESALRLSELLSEAARVAEAGHSTRPTA